MQISTRGLIEIASHEGICLRPYLDSVGVLTWGVGHTNAAGPPDISKFPLDQDQPMGAVFAVFRNDLASVEADVNRLVKIAISQNKFDALCSFHYNTGGLGRAQLLLSINRGDFDAAADQFMNWSKPPEIIPRRQKEQALFRDGTYSANGKALVFPVNPRTQKPIYGKGYEVNVASLLVAEKPQPDEHPAPLPPINPIPVPRPRPPPSAPSQPPLTQPPFGGFFLALLRFIQGLFR